MVTSGAMFAGADVIVQKYVEENGKVQPQRVAKVTAVGAFGLAPILHKWFGEGLPWIYKNVLQRFLPGIFAKSTALKEACGMILFDQTIGAVSINWLIIFLFGFLESFNASKAVAATNSCIRDVVFASWKIWPASNFLNFFLVPMHYRVLFSNITGFFWTIYVTWRAHAHREAEGKEPEESIV
jgi:hypothetical protein